MDLETKCIYRNYFRLPKSRYGLKLRSVAGEIWTSMNLGNALPEIQKKQDLTQENWEEKGVHNQHMLEIALSDEIGGDSDYP